MERRMMEGEGLFLPEPLFVKPVVLHYSPETLRGAARMSMKARELLMDGYSRMQAKDYDGADAAFRQASALTPSPQVLEARSRLLVARGDPKGALRLLKTFPNRSALAAGGSSLPAHRAATATRALGSPPRLATAPYAAGLNPRRRCAFRRAARAPHGRRAICNLARRSANVPRVPTVAANLGSSGSSATACARVATSAYYEKQSLLTERAARPGRRAVELPLSLMKV
jgi:hypothetical protein